MSWKQPSTVLFVTTPTLWCIIFSLVSQTMLSCDWQIMTGPLFLLEAWKGKGQSSTGSDICVTTATGVKLPRRLQVVDFKQGWRQLTWALLFLERRKSIWKMVKKKHFVVYICDIKGFFSRVIQCESNVCVLACQMTPNLCHLAG